MSDTARKRTDLSPRKQELLRQKLQSISKKREAEASSPIRRVSRDKNAFSLSFAQQRLWFLDQLEPDSAFYTICDTSPLIGDINISALERSISEVVRRHEILRTVFAVENETPRQIIKPYRKVILPVVDLTELSLDQIRAEAARLVAQESYRPFNLAQGPLFRPLLIKAAHHQHALLLSMHHIISDAWSANVLNNELTLIYDAYNKGLPSPVPELDLQYVDYAVWQRDWLQGDVLKQELDYWKNHLKGAPSVLKLPTDKPRPAIQRYVGATWQFALSAEIGDGLRKLSRKTSATMFMTMLCGFEVLLRRYTGELDIVVGTPNAGRNFVELERLIGFFVNTLALRVKLTPEATLSDALNEVKEVALGAYAHQEIPFEKIVEELKVERSLSHNPLFQVMFAMQNVPGQQIELTKKSMGREQREIGTAMFDLLLLFAETTAGEIYGIVEYSTDLFEEERIKRMVGHLQRVLEAMLRDMEQRVSEVDLLSEQEREQILIEWNSTFLAYDKSRCVHELFEHQVARTPQAVAVEYKGKPISYRELNDSANRLAHRLTEFAVSGDVLVGIYLTRDAEMIVALLAVLKAGGAYVPLDILNPAERIAYALENARVSVILTRKRLAESLPATSAKIVCIDVEDLSAEPDKNLGKTANPNNLAYVIYTSGSTGKPKGVAIEHANCVSMIEWAANAYTRQELRSVLASTSICFDLSVYEIFLPLTVGGKIIVINNALELLAAEAPTDATLINTVPSAMRALLKERALPSAIVTVNLAGEALRRAEAEHVYEQNHVARVVNLYGPTECTTYSTEAILKKADPTEVSIGRPISNTKVYVLDEKQSLVPAGVAGELFISGAGVARGYINQADQTAARFLPNPYGNPGERMYRTGDLVKYRLDGEIEFLGRLDHQVKVRGYRIELGEIESAIAGYPGVKQAVVELRESPNREMSLVAYIAEKEGETVTVGDLKKYLRLRLPEYMIPASCVVLDEVPLTSNGKIDRRALPNTIGGLAEQTYAAPRSYVEMALAEVWSSVLNLEKVGIHDNFFALGGDSITSVWIVSNAKRKGLQLTVRDLFQYQTIAELAEVLSTDESIDPKLDAMAGPAPLVAAQLYFLNSIRPSTVNASQSLLIELDGEIDLSRLQRAAESLLARHDVFRLRFSQGGMKWRQEYANSQRPDCLLTLDLSAITDGNKHGAIEAILEKLRSGADLSAERPARVALIKSGNREANYLVITISHLIVDDLSWNVLLEEIQSAYERLETYDAVSLPPVGASFRDWVVRLNQLSHSQDLLKEKQYWMTISGAVASSADSADETASTDEADTFEVILNARQTELLRNEVPLSYRTTVAETLQAALAIASGKLKGETALLFDLLDDGRDVASTNLDVSRTVGRFSYAYPVVLRANAAQTIGEALKSLKEQIRAIPNKGLGYVTLRYANRDQQIAESLSELSEPETSFKFFGTGDQSLNGYLNGDRCIASPSSLKRSLFSKAVLSNSNSRPYRLAITAAIAEGELRIRWKFNKDFYDLKTIETMAKACAETIDEIIDHCCAQKAFGYTPSDFPLAGLTQQELDCLLGDNRNIEDVCRLSPMQEGMLYDSVSSSRFQAYYRQMSFPLSGHINIKAFETAWQKLTDRHGVLRTAFFWNELEHPVQVVYKNAKISIEQNDWRLLSESERRRQLNALMLSKRERGIDISSAPVLDLSLIRMADDEYLFLWNDHHILMDGWSQGLLIKELMMIYSSVLSGENLRLEPVRPFRDYIEWLQKQDLELAEDFWRKNLKGFKKTSLLPIMRRPGGPNRNSESSALNSCSLTEKQTSELVEFARENRVTLNTILQGMWALLLSRFLGETDILFGATVLGRPANLPGVESMVGVFINTLPTRIVISEEEEVVTYLSRLQEQLLRVREYEYSPLSKIQQWAETKPGQGLFETLFVFQELRASRTPTETESQQQETSNEDEDAFNFMGRNFRLMLFAVPGQRLRLKLDFDKTKFDSDQIGRLVSGLKTLLESVSSRPRCLVADLEVLTKQQRRELLLGRNDERLSLDEHEMIHHMFEAQARATPQAIAVIDNQHSLTYDELNTRADILADYLRSLGAGAEVAVGIFLEKSVDLAVALLATLKAGGVCVPIDAACPRQWLDAMLNDSEPKIILTQSKLADTLGEHSSAKTIIDCDWDIILQRAQQNLPSISDATSYENISNRTLACVIWTAGYSGQPKAIAIEHRNLVALLKWVKSQFPAGCQTRVLASSSVSARGAVFEIFGPLVTGGSVLLAECEPGLPALPGGERFNLIHASPTAISNLIGKQNLPAFIETLIFSGEALLSERLKDIREAQSAARILNVYGAAEASIFSAYAEVQSEVQSPDDTLIERAITGSSIFVLDRNLHLVPAGAQGRIYIGGECLARGYMNDPQRTAESFIPNPFSDKPGERLYRSDDLASYAADGRIEFLSRDEEVIKAGGNSVSLKHVKDVLQYLPSVKEAIVIAKRSGDGKSRLIIYFTPKKEEVPAYAELRLQFKKALGGIHIPSEFIRVETLPLTLFGQIDRQSLPEPPPIQEDIAEGYVAPKDLLEAQLVQIWEEILVARPIGIKDNFFDLGGSSLLTLRLSSEINLRTGKTLPLDAMIKNPTIEYIAEILREQETNQSWSPLVPLQLQGSNPPLFCFHAIDGYVFVYVKLAERLAGVRACYGLQARGLIEGQKHPASIEEMAADYIEIIKTVQPSGPYLLCGQSSGGLIALEVAQQLIERGDKVGLLAMFDTKQLTTDTVDTYEAAYEKSVEQLVKQYASLLAISDEDIEQVAVEDRLGYIIERAQSTELLPRSLSEQRIRQMISFVIMSFTTFQLYKAKPYPGRILLFRPEEQIKTDEDKKDLDSGWKQLAEGGVDIEITPGNHLDHILEPYAAVVAKTLERYIEKALSE